MLASIRTTASRLVNRAARYVEVAPSQMMTSTTRASVLAAGSSEVMDFQPDCVKNAHPSHVQCVGGDADRIANHHGPDHSLVNLGLDDHLTGVAHVEDASVRLSSEKRLLVFRCYRRSVQSQRRAQVLWSSSSRQQWRRPHYPRPQRYVPERCQMSGRSE